MVQTSFVTTFLWWLSCLLASVEGFNPLNPSFLQDVDSNSGMCAPRPEAPRPETGNKFKNPSVAFVKRSSDFSYPSFLQDDSNHEMCAPRSETGNESKVPSVAFAKHSSDFKCPSFLQDDDSNHEMCAPRPETGDKSKVPSVAFAKRSSAAFASRHGSSSSSKGSSSEDSSEGSSGGSSGGSGGGGGSSDEGTQLEPAKPESKLAKFKKKLFNLFFNFLVWLLNTFSGLLMTPIKEEPKDVEHHGHDDESTFAPFGPRNLDNAFRRETSHCGGEVVLLSAENGNNEDPDHVRFEEFFRSKGYHPPARNLWEDAEPSPLEKFTGVVDRMLDAYEEAEKEAKGNDDDSVERFRKEKLGDDGGGLLKAIEKLEDCKRKLPFLRLSTSSWFADMCLQYEKVQEEKLSGGLLNSIEKLEEPKRSLLYLRLYTSSWFADMWVQYEKVQVEEKLSNIAMLLYLAVLREMPMTDEFRQIGLAYKYIIMHNGPKHRLRMCMSMDPMKLYICPNGEILDPLDVDPRPFRSGFEMWNPKNRDRHEKFVLSFQMSDLPAVILQYSRTCYAPTVSMLISYLLKRQYPNEPYKIIDWNSIVECHFDEKRMMERVNENRGGNPKALLLDLLDDPKLHEIGLDQSGEKIAEAIDKYGPAIVPGFYIHKSVNEKLKSGEPMVLSGNFTIDKPRNSNNTHAMLLTGARKMKGETWKFFFQNWWQDALWIEADIDHFRSAMADSVGSGVKKPSRKPAYSKLIFVEGPIQLVEECRDPSANKVKVYGDDGGAEPFEPDPDLY